MIDLKRQPLDVKTNPSQALIWCGFLALEMRFGRYRRSRKRTKNGCTFFIRLDSGCEAVVNIFTFHEHTYRIEQAHNPMRRASDDYICGAGDILDGNTLRTGNGNAGGKVALSCSPNEQTRPWDWQI